MDATVLSFFAYAANMAVQFADGYLTQDGLTHKLIEGNSITARMFKKIGVAATNGIKIGALPIVAIIVDLNSGWPGALNATLAAVTMYPVVKNFLLLRKNKISIF